MWTLGEERNWSGDDWKTQFQQLLKAYDEQKRKLMYSEKHNQYLKEELQEKKDLMGEKDNVIQSLKNRLCVVEEQLEEAQRSQSDTERRLGDVKGELEKREEELSSLKSLQPSQQDLGELEELRSSEKSLHEEVGQLRELLEDKEQEVSRANKKRERRTKAHVDTLFLLSQTEAALKDSEQRCCRLEEELQTKLAEQQQRLLEELSLKDQSFRKELCGSSKASEEPSELCNHWEAADVKKVDSEGERAGGSASAQQEESTLQQRVQQSDGEDVQLQVSHLTCS